MTSSEGLSNEQKLASFIGSIRSLKTSLYSKLNLLPQERSESPISGDFLKRSLDDFFAQVNMLHANSETPVQETVEEPEEK